MGIISSQEFHKRMSHFKKTVKVFKEERMNCGYFLNPDGLDFLHTEKYDENETGIPAMVLHYYIQDYMFNKEFHPMIVVEESWRDDEEHDIYIELYDLADEGKGGIFDIWHNGRVTRVKYEYDGLSDTRPPKSIRLEQVCVVMKVQ